MGRIHRYGQKEDVLVFNLVAKNTREGKVLGKLLEKLDIIRSQIGDDRVYDVISDVFEEVSLDDITHSTLDGQYTHYNHVIDTRLTNEAIKQKIREQKASLACSKIDYKDARHLKETSDEKRLQPIYIRMFFEKAFRSLGGEFQQIRKSIFKITKIPDVIFNTLRDDYNMRADVRDILFCFHKSDESIADERLMLVCGNHESEYSTTSPAKLIDLQPPVKFAKTINPPDAVSVDDVQMWSFSHITKPHFEETADRA